MQALTAFLLAFPKLVESINLLIGEIKLIRNHEIERQVNLRIEELSKNIEKLKKAQSNEEIKTGLNDLYNSIYK